MFFINSFIGVYIYLYFITMQSYRFSTNYLYRIKENAYIFSDYKHLKTPLHQIPTFGMISQKHIHQT